MPQVPESNLRDVLNKLIDATTTNASARKTAVRWFNRLYFDVRRWNESFIAFLKTYPGFASTNPPGAYKQFIDRLEEYRISLETRHGTVKNDLCTNLRILSARYPRDFAWLSKENPGLYDDIRALIDESYETEAEIMVIALSVCQFIWEIGSDENWHIQHHDEVVSRIREYEDASKQAVAILQKTAESAGSDSASRARFSSH